MKTWNLKQMADLAKQCRKHQNLSRRALAESAGVSVYSVTKLEKGEGYIGIEDAVKICKMLQISTDFLLTGELGLPEMVDLNRKLMSAKDFDTENLNKIATAFWETCPVMETGV